MGTGNTQAEKGDFATQINSNTIHVDPAHPEFIGSEIITQEEAVAMFGYDFSAPNTYAEHEIPNDEAIAETIEAQEQQWAPPIK